MNAGGYLKLCYRSHWIQERGVYGWCRFCAGGGEIQSDHSGDRSKGDRFQYDAIDGLPAIVFHTGCNDELTLNSNVRRNGLSEEAIGFIWPIHRIARAKTLFWISSENYTRNGQARQTG
jgi:hypothetical protein